MDQVVNFVNGTQGLSVFDARQWYQLAQCSGDAKKVAQVCDWYACLLQTVASNGEGVLPCDMAAFLRLSTELVLFMFDGDLLVATAQGSLVRPGGRPEVVVSNVVVESSRRGRGYGAAVVRRLEIVAAERWVLPKSSRLRAEVPNARVAMFFARLGYSTIGDAIAYKGAS